MISAPENSLYGHPHPEVLERIEEAGGDWYQTGLAGAVTAEVQGGEVLVTGYRGTLHLGRMSFILIKNEEAGAGGSEENEMDSLYIIIPAYNEEENILRVLEDWYPVVERHSGEGRSRLVVVDDGSRDGTRRILEEYAAEHPLLVPLTKKNGGHARPCFTATVTPCATGRIISFRRTATDRRCRRNLNRSGRNERLMIW